VVKYVLDTNVVSALRRPALNRAVSAWSDTVLAERTFITAFTIAEIGRGIAATERTDPKQAAIYRDWFNSEVLGTFANRILPFDFDAALVMATYRVPEHAPMMML